MTDADLRDAAVAELKQTTVGYLNTHWQTPPPGSHWANALDRLALIGAAPPPPPPPPPSSGFDAFKGLCMYADSDFAKAAQLVGTKHARCDWPSAARVAAAKAAGIQVLPIACYAHGHGADDHAPPSDLNGWLAALKADLIGAWQSPPAVEIWNEPWGSGFWHPEPNPVAYMALFKAAAEAVWSVRPDTLVLVSADTNGNVNTSGTNNWRANLLKADTTGLLADPRIRPTTHPYCEWRTPTQITSQPCSWDLDRFKCAYTDFRAHGHPFPKVWVTEFGWEVVNEGVHHYGGAANRQVQADWTVEAIKIFQTSGMVERAYCFYFQTSNTWSYNWLDTNNLPRPVCAAVKALA